MAVPPLTHVQAAWEAFAHIYQPLAEHFHLVWYDFRGTGLSDREAIDFSMDAMIRDVEAVVESARLTGFAMVAIDAAVPIAVTYAATRPEKVSSLILLDGLMKFSDYYQNPGIVAEESLRSAVAAGAVSTLEVGAGRFDPRDVARLAAAVEIEELEPVAAKS